MTKNWYLKSRFLIFSEFRIKKFQIFLPKILLQFRKKSDFQNLIFAGFRTGLVLIPTDGTNRGANSEGSKLGFHLIQSLFVYISTEVSIHGKFNHYFDEKSVFSLWKSEKIVDLPKFMKFLARNFENLQHLDFHLWKYFFSTFSIIWQVKKGFVYIWINNQPSFFLFCMKIPEKLIWIGTTIGTNSWYHHHMSAVPWIKTVIDFKAQDLAKSKPTKDLFFEREHGPFKNF